LDEEGLAMPLTEEQNRETDITTKTKLAGRRISMRLQLIAALLVISLLIYGFSRMHQALAELAK
jgi:flagellar biogenesis protein FliO